MNDKAPKISLKRMIAVGFIGNSPLSDTPAVSPEVTGDLRTALSKLDGDLFVVTTLSATSELLFAEQARKLGLPIQLILPLPAEELFLQMEPQAALVARTIFAHAFHTVELKETLSLAVSYTACRQEVFERCDLLITLASDADGRSASLLAQQLGRATVCLGGTDAASGSMRHTEHLESADETLAFLNHLPDLHVPMDGATPEQHAQQWFQKLDANANRYSRARRIASIPILYTASAGLLSSAATASHASHVLLAASVIVGLSAGASPIVLQMKRRQSDWARTRTAAEACRSMLAVWNAPFQEESGGIELSTEFAGVMNSLRYLRLQSNASGTQSLQDFKTHYGSQRILDQRRYYERQAARAVRELRWSKRIMRGSIGGAVLLAVACLGGTLNLPFLAKTSQNTWFGFLVTVFFQVGTVVGAMEIVNHTRRRQSRYAEIARSLHVWEQQLSRLETWSAVQNLVSRTERALLIELVEWQSLLRNSKFL